MRDSFLTAVQASTIMYDAIQEARISMTNLNDAFREMFSIKPPYEETDWEVRMKWNSKI